MRYEVEIIESGRVTTERFTSRKRAMWRYHNLRRAHRLVDAEVAFHDLQESKTLKVKMPGSSQTQQGEVQ